MRNRVGRLLLGAALVALVPFGRGALAGDLDSLKNLTLPGLADLPVVVPAADDASSDQQAAPKGEFHGDITAGWNFFIKRPPSGYGYDGGGVPLTASQTNSIAGLEQYGEVPKGPFLSGVNLDYASGDGLFVAKFRAKNIGQDTQDYRLRLGQPGVHDLIFEYNQIPHLVSTSGKTLYNTSNPAYLTVPNAVQSALQADLAGSNYTAANNTINGNVKQIELKTERDIARVVYGYKPDPAWDLRASYTHEDKRGTYAQGTDLNGFSGAIEVPAPIDYTTQTIGASAQYMGMYGNNKHYNVGFAYAGSIFDDHNQSVTYENPFHLTPPTPADTTPNLGRSGLYPDNYANRYSLTAGVDLPFDSRYMGTVTYNQMRQNQSFIPKTINPALVTTPLPATSLHGKVDTLLINNVVNTNWTDNVTSTLRYRYYDKDNHTPELLFSDYVRGDYTVNVEDVRNLAMGYTQQDANADLTWRALDWLTLGAGYQWENYDRTRRGVNVTNENSGKFSLDANPFDWMHLRASYLLAYRRYDNYDALAYVGIPAYPPTGAGFGQSPFMRKYDMSNRDRQKVQASLELTTPIEGLMVTPNGSWEENRYMDGSSSGGAVGLKQDTTWTAGVEVAYAPMTEVSLLAGYLHEDMNRALVNNDVHNSLCTGAFGDTNCNWGSRLQDIVDTVYAGANFQLIPDSLFLKVSYSFSQAIGKTAQYNLGSVDVVAGSQYPEVKTYTHALNAKLSYKMDEDLVRRLGWVGDVTASLNYTFAYNQMNNWQIDNITPYMYNTDSGSSQSLFLGFINPNYIAHYIGVTTEIHW